ncbi:hypothetical protein Glove_264g59 [Diversispora epigaea]|uniref:C2H2-type domain-containing protein n=1 Tax=Diversispora epigaea TaxID=1348612 RepID=A0A397I7V2_9GLOM|nr:hypothetical protein Glove_264g59 [Diversispora epigaea]
MITIAFECPFCNCVLSSRSAYSQHVKRCSENYDSSSSSSSEEIQNEFDIITPEQDENSEDNRNNEIIYISDDEPMFSSRSNETSDIMQVKIDELPQSMNSLTFEEFASIRYEEPASREPEFETDESKSKSDETETESESKSDKIENESEESEKSESAEEEFPNNTYADLMTLVIQHNLNNKAGNAIIRFFNKHSNLLISPLPKNIEQSRKLMDKMKSTNLLNKEKVMLNYNNKDYIIYYRPIINCIKNILSIKDIHKYITFNFKNDQTNNNRNCNEQYTSNWWTRTEKTLSTGSYLLSIILYSDVSTTDSLGKNTLYPIFVTLGNIITWRRNKLDVKQLLAYLPIIKAKDDTQKISEEHKNIVRRTFHKSLKFLLSPLYDDNEPRSHNNIKLYYKNNTGKNVSIENVRNFFWSVPNINIYATTVPDKMHHLDLGLFQHQLNFTKILINKQCGKSFIDKMNNRVKLIPPIKIKNHELYEDSRSPNFIKNNKITEVYLKWNKMYLLSRKENYEESDFQFPKLHSWVFYICSSIRKFGAINGYTTETYESLHKDYVKKPYKLTNKKEIEKQIMKIIHRKAIITESFSKEIPKTPIALKYSKKLYEFCIQNAEIYIQTRMNDPDLEKEMKLGFEKFLECLDVYLEIYYQNLSEHEKIDMIFHIYSGVTLKFGSIIRATNKFHKKLIFSNIAVEMNADEIFEYTSDNGVCFA